MPWDKNPRGIKTKDFERLKKQILRLGVYKPLVVYEDGGKYIVLGGNMRIRALKELGIREVEVSVVEAETEAKRIEYALSDNDRAGFYEEEKLAELVYPEIQNLDLNQYKVDLGEGLDLRGVVEGYGPSLSGQDDEGSDESIDDEPAITKPGELFAIGNHRLMCGDSTDPKALSRLTGDREICLSFLDPPYEMKIADEWLDGVLEKSSCTILLHNDKEILRLASVFQKTFRYFLVCERAFAVTANKYMPLVHHTLAAVFFEKNTFSALRPPFSSRLDNFVKPGTYQKNLMHLERLVSAYSRPGDTILDPFGGSGQTLIAAEKQGRACLMAELEPELCDRIIRRYSRLSGIREKAIRKSAASDIRGAVRSE